MTSLDLGILESIRELQSEGDPNLLATVVKMYLEAAPERLLKIEQAIRAADSDALESEAHGLKSSSASIGAATLASFCQKLETQGHLKELAGAPEVFEALKQEFSKTEAELLALPEMKKANGDRDAA